MNRLPDQPQGMPFGPMGPNGPGGNNGQNGPDFRPGIGPMRGRNFGPDFRPQVPVPQNQRNLPPDAFARQQFVPNMNRPGELQSSIGGVAGGEMGMRLRQAMLSGEISRAQMMRWSQEPWLAYPFLQGVLRTNDPMMQGLSRWYLAARIGRTPEEQRAMALRWEQTEGPMAAGIRQLIGSTNSGLNTAMDTRLATTRELRQFRESSSTNVLEGFGGKFMDYMRDWREHPVTAAGVVVGFYMLFKAIKNRNIGTVLGLGAAGIALYSFFRDQYGIEPIESLIAKPLEKWGLPTASNIVRKTRDTIRRPFEPAEVEGSAFSYLGDKIGVNGDDEKRMLAVIWEMKPGEFLAAHQAVYNQSIASPDQRVQLPPAAREVMRRMGADATQARKWANYTERQRADIFLAVGNKVLGSMPGGMRFGAKFISDRYVTGAYFDEARAQRGGRYAGSRIVTPQEAQISTDFSYAVRTADMNMGDVLISTVMNPQDWQAIQGYRHGLGATQMINGLGTAWNRAWGWGTGVLGTAWDVVGDEVPAAWNYNVWPFLNRNGFNRETALGVVDQASIALRQARNSVGGFADFVQGSTLFRVSKEGVLYVWDKGSNVWKQLWGDLDNWARNRELIRTRPPTVEVQPPPGPSGPVSPGGPSFGPVTPGGPSFAPAGGPGLGPPVGPVAP